MFDLTLARLRSSSCAALMFSVLPPQARKTEACHKNIYPLQYYNYFYFQL